jgi:hypothetical protein
MTWWKQGLGLAGMVAAGVAVLTGQRAIFWVAAGLLVASIALRIVERVRARRAEAAQDTLSEHRDE